MDLQSRWNEFTGHPEYWSIIKNAYTAKNRYYHTLEHIEFCIRELDKVKHMVNNSNAMEMAIWFHDIVYDFNAKDNEYKSMVVAINFIKDNMPELTFEFKAKVAELIMATVHNGKAFTNDEQIICDIDLAALGETPEIFERNQMYIKQEYAKLSDKEFIKGSTMLLIGFLAREFIYYTDYFRTNYETKARYNIRNRIYSILNFL